MRWLALMLCLAGCAGAPMTERAAEDVDPDRVTHDLTGTRWALERLGAQQVVLGEQAREPFIALQAPTPRIVGHAGCNRLMGSYVLSSDRIRFDGIGTTRMYCEHMAVETDLLQALAATRGWRIEADRLTLLDGEGEAVATFLARNL